MASMIAVYNGPGTDSFCVDQTIKSYQNQVDDRIIQVGVRDHQNLWQAITDKDVKWIVFPGGNAYEMIKVLTDDIKDDLKKVWESTDKKQIGGICAGAICLADNTSCYFQNTKNQFMKSRSFPGVGIYEGKVAAPCLTWTNPGIDPSNCKSVEVKHLLSDNSEILFDSLMWMGPGLPQNEANVIRTITEDVFICTDEEPPPFCAFDELHSGANLPISVMQESKSGNKVYLQCDHLEIDPHALNEELFVKLYTASKEKRQESMNYNPNTEDISKKSREKSYQETRNRLLLSNGSRLVALRDGMARIDIPLKV